MFRLITGGAVALALATNALAAEPWGPPRSVAEVKADGAGTIIGTVAGRLEEGFTLTDGAGEVPVRSEHLALDAVKPAETVTVTGMMKEGALRPEQVVREDGTAVEPRADEGKDKDAGKDEDAGKGGGKEEDDDQDD
jgi:hypothetical protein